MFDSSEMSGAPEGGQISGRVFRDEEIVAQAKAQYPFSSVEIPDNPSLFIQSDGAWVQARVWVPFPKGGR